MNRFIVMTSLAGALLLPLLAAPGTASASCADRKMTGTVLGGVGGALIGNSISRGGGGAFVGGLGGAVLGHEVAASGCGRTRSSRYDNGRTYGQAGGRPRAVRYVYYDQYGQPISQGPAPSPAARPDTAYRYEAAADCRTQTQTYYDDRATLQQRQIRSCAR